MKNLTNLKELSIYRYPLLKDRCTKETGPEWPKISHIPFHVMKLRNACLTELESLVTFQEENIVSIDLVQVTRLINSQLPDIYPQLKVLSYLMGRSDDADWLKIQSQQFNHLLHVLMSSCYENEKYPPKVAAAMQTNNALWTANVCIEAMRHLLKLAQLDIHGVQVPGETCALSVSKFQLCMIASIHVLSATSS